MIGRHVFAALLASCIVAGGLSSAKWYVRSLEDRYIHAIAPKMFALKNQGSQLQAEAF
jgi:outer membrane murein-binding lipoprotein Lpp